MLLGWAAEAVEPEAVSLVRIFAARKAAEARATGMRPDLAGRAFKRWWMLWETRSQPRLWFNRAFLASFGPALPGPA